jgi:Ni/Co efflux regulator RcnB
MRMVAGVLVVVAGVPCTPAVAQSDADRAANAAAAAVTTRTSTAPARHIWGGRHQGRWIAGWRAPGGWSAYRPVYRGASLPAYWISPRFYIADFGRYGFAPPPPGFGWSRYYDDAVLTDRYGRVFDAVRSVEWDRTDSYDDGEHYDAGFVPHSERGQSDNKAAGAVIGGVVGAVAGNVIADKGDRLAGSLIGAGVGAAAGAAIGGATERRGERFEGERRRRYSGPLPYDEGGYRGRFDGDVTYDGRWAGTWTGSYDGGPEQVYKGAFEGDYRGAARHHGGHWGGSHWDGPVDHVVYHNGYGDTVTTITFTPQPMPVTTTTVTEYIDEPAPARPVARRSYLPRSKARRVIR